MAESRLMTRITLGLLGVLAFTLLSQNALVIPGVGTFTRLCGIAAAVTGAFAVFEQGGVRRVNTVTLAMVAFVGWSLVSSTWTIAPDRAAQRIGTYLQGIVLALLLWNFAGSAKVRHRLLGAYVAGSVILSASLIHSRLTATNRIFDWGYTRYTAFNTDPNESGILLATAIPVAWYLATVTPHRRLAFLLRLYTPVIATAILLTGSRGGFVTMLTALLFLLTTVTPRRMHRGLVRVGAATVVGILLVSFVVPESTLARFGTIAGELTTGTMSNRKIIWKAGLGAFAASPVTGIGLGSYADTVLREAGLFFEAHNTFIAVLVQQGIVGFFLLLALLALLVANVQTLPRNERRMYLFLLATWATGGMSLALEYKKETWFLLGLLAAVRPGKSRRAPDSAPDEVASAHPSPRRPTPALRRSSREPMTTRAKGG